MSNKDRDAACKHINGTSLCVGTGRFLRAVLVPVLNQATGLQGPPVLIQPRGSSFVDYYQEQRKESQKDSYEVDTVLHDGSVKTDNISCGGVFSWSSFWKALEEANETTATSKLPAHFLSNLRVLGIGVTEAGLRSPDEPVMYAVYKLLQRVARGKVNIAAAPKLCVVNTDNVSHNGEVLRGHMETLAMRNSNGDGDDISMINFLEQNVVFLDTMVDRITAHREGNVFVPRAEPLPTKALVVLDPRKLLLKTLIGDDANTKIPGLVWRTESLETDIALKLRIANGTHTAVAHLLALQGKTSTIFLGEMHLVVEYLDALVHDQILPALDQTIRDEGVAVYDDWRRRLLHPHFGLSTFFITQNGAAKGGIRLSPTVQDLCTKQHTVSASISFAFAVLLRWLTPVQRYNEPSSTTEGSYIGKLPRNEKRDSRKFSNETVQYADGLQFNLSEAWYNFRCACTVLDESSKERNLCEWLKSIPPSQPAAYLSVIRAYLLAENGGNLIHVATAPESRRVFDDFVGSIALLYARMQAGDDLFTLLQEMKDKQGVYCNDGYGTSSRELTDAHPGSSFEPLHHRCSPVPGHSSLMTCKVTLDTVSQVVRSEVAAALAIDVHTHLLPPTHGPLCLWGIDDMLTYHYLVAEYFMTAPPSVTPDTFYSLGKKEQAETIWDALFVNRTPLSEACRGVVTTLCALGLQGELVAGNLKDIRSFYQNFPGGADGFCEYVHSKAGVQYNIMTNIPFNQAEAAMWFPDRAAYSSRFRSALRVDPFLAGDRKTVENALAASGYEMSLEGARQFLRDWCDRMKPEYMMASTPHDFVLRDEPQIAPFKTNVNEISMSKPGAFALVTKRERECDPSGKDVPTMIDEHSDFLGQVLVKVCEERDLPIALKIGAHRGVNPSLRMAGDGMVAFADTSMLVRLCNRFPSLRILATFLSRNNQHEACVLASKFRNLHIYGCWWYCSSPSIVHEITTMRLEMLGSSFTAQHSDARVLDQMIYKWAHARSTLAVALDQHFSKLLACGWLPQRRSVRADVKMLLGGSFVDFMKRSTIEA